MDVGSNGVQQITRWVWVEHSHGVVYMMLVNRAFVGQPWGCRINSVGVNPSDVASRPDGVGGLYLSLIICAHRTSSSVEIVGETGEIEEATGCFDFELTVILTSIHPQIDGVNGFRVGGEKSRGGDGESWIVLNTVESSFIAVLSSGSEVVPSATIPVAVLNELSRH